MINRRAALHIARAGCRDLGPDGAVAAYRSARRESGAIRGGLRHAVVAVIAFLCVQQGSLMARSQHIEHAAAAPLSTPVAPLILPVTLALALGVTVKSYLLWKQQQR